MFDFRFEGDNTITLLEQPDVAKREVKPVWAEELNILGVDKFFNYPRSCKDPLLWRCASRYYYCGIPVFKTKYIDPDTQPNIQILDSLYKEFKPINIKKLIDRNEKLLEKVLDITITEANKTLDTIEENIDTFICGYSGGKDSTVLLDVVLKLIPLKKLIIQNNDTGMEYTKTIEFVQSVIKDLLCEHPEIRFQTISSDLPATRTWRIIGFPSRMLRWCCRVHKSAPTIRYSIEHSLGRILQIFGQRRAESAQRSEYQSLSKGELGELAFHPILDWSSAEVWLYIFYKNLPFNPLYKSGLTRVGCFLCPMSSGISCFFSKRIEPERTKQLQEIVASQSRIHPRHKDIFKEVRNGLCFEAWKGQRGGRYLDILPRGLVERTRVVPLIREEEAARDWLKVGDLTWQKEWVVSGKKSIIEKGYAIKALFCVGCGVCAAFCKQQAISFVDVESKDGRRRPVIDFDKCIKCYNCLYTGVGYDRCFAHSRQRLNKKETIERIKHEYPKADLLSLPEEIES